MGYNGSVAQGKFAGSKINLTISLEFENSPERIIIMMIILIKSTYEKHSSRLTFSRT